MTGLPSRWGSQEGEKIVANLEVNREGGIVLTNLRVIIWEGVGEAELVTPIRLRDLQRVVLKPDRAHPLRLLLGLGLCVAGAPLLPQLIPALSELGALSRHLGELGRGALGVALVVVGLVVVTGYLSRLLYPRGWIHFRGIPEMEVVLSAEAYRQAPGLIRRIQQLKET